MQAPLHFHPEVLTKGGTLLTAKEDILPGDPRRSCWSPESQARGRAPASSRGRMKLSPAQDSSAASHQAPATPCAPGMRCFSSEAPRGTFSEGLLTAMLSPCRGAEHAGEKAPSPPTHTKALGIPRTALAPAAHKQGPPPTAQDRGLTSWPSLSLPIRPRYLCVRTWKLTPFLIPAKGVSSQANPSASRSPQARPQLLQR